MKNKKYTKKEINQAFIQELNDIKDTYSQVINQLNENYGKWEKSFRESPFIKKENSLLEKIYCKLSGKKLPPTELEMKINYFENKRLEQISYFTIIYDERVKMVKDFMKESNL